MGKDLGLEVAAGTVGHDNAQVGVVHKRVAVCHDVLVPQALEQLDLSASVGGLRPPARQHRHSARAHHAAMRTRAAAARAAGRDPATCTTKRAGRAHLIDCLAMLLGALLDDEHALQHHVARAALLLPRKVHAAVGPVPDTLHGLVLVAQEPALHPGTAAASSVGPVYLVEPIMPLFDWVRGSWHNPRTLPRRPMGSPRILAALMGSPRILAALSLLLSHACEAFVLPPTAGCLPHTHGRCAAAGRWGGGIRTLAAQADGGDDGGKALFESLRARQAQLKEEEKTLLSRWRSGECASKAALFLDDYVVGVSHSQSAFLATRVLGVICARPLTHPSPQTRQRRISLDWPLVGLGSAGGGVYVADCNTGELVATTSSAPHPDYIPTAEADMDMRLLVCVCARACACVRACECGGCASVSGGEGDADQPYTAHARTHWRCAAPMAPRRAAGITYRVTVCATCSTAITTVGVLRR